MNFVRKCGRAVMSAIVAVLAFALVVYVWYKWPATVVSLLDVNLKLIKIGCGLLSQPYAAMAESALRGALGADKALLFAEGALVINSVLFGLCFLIPARIRARFRGR